MVERKRGKIQAKEPDGCCRMRKTSKHKENENWMTSDYLEQNKYKIWASLSRSQWRNGVICTSCLKVGQTENVTLQVHVSLRLKSSMNTKHYLQCKTCLLWIPRIVKCLVKLDLATGSGQIEATGRTYSWVCLRQMSSAHIYTVHHISKISFWFVPNPILPSVYFIGVQFDAVQLWCDSQCRVVPVCSTTALHLLEVAMANTSRWPSSIFTTCPESEHIFTAEIFSAVKTAIYRT